jgi:hypothetical protein
MALPIMVARNFTYEKCVDYIGETFLHMAIRSPLYILLSLATIYDLHVHQIDVKTMFLDGHLHEEVYMEQLEGYVNPRY